MRTGTKVGLDIKAKCCNSDLHKAGGDLYSHCPTSTLILKNRRQKKKNKQRWLDSIVPYLVGHLYSDPINESLIFCSFELLLFVCLFVVKNIEEKNGMCMCFIYNICSYLCKNWQ